MPYIQNDSLKPYCLALTLLALAVSAPGTAAQTRAERIDSVVRSSYEAGSFHGGVLVADGAEVVYRAAFGIADRESDEPNRPETLSPIYSITKPFTAVLVLQLVQEGVLELDGTVEEYLPGFASTSADRITVHHLLSHTSGLPDYMLEIPGYMQYEPPNLSRDSVLGLVARMPLEFEPGQGFAYTNTGYVLLGSIIERVTGMPYARVLEERIFEPLGMRSSRWMETEEGPAIARQYMPGAEREAPAAVVFAGEAGIVSTLDDMHRFARAIGSPELLSSELWALALTPQARPEDAMRPHPGTRFPYGYGFSIVELPGDSGAVRGVLHGGLGYGGSAMFQHFPDRGWTLVFWSNVGGLIPEIPGLLEVLAADAASG